MAVLVTADVLLPQKLLVPLAEVNPGILAVLLTGATAALEELRNYYFVTPILHVVYQ